MNLAFVKKIFFSKNISLLIPFALVAILFVIVPAALILIFAFTPVNSQSNSGDNFAVIDDFLLEKIFSSLWIACVTVIICILFAYPLCYFLSSSNNLVFRSTVMLLLTAPMWCSVLVKLIGIKSFFDIVNGCINSTYGDIYSIIGLVYIFFPFILVPLYSCLTSMPKSFIQASQDLGYNMFRTFFNVVIPYTKTSLISGMSLVFLPCFTTVAVPQFLNNANNNELIGDIIFQVGSAGITNNAQLVIASALSIIVVFVAFVFWFFIRVIPFAITFFRQAKWKWLRIVIKEKWNWLLSTINERR